MSKGRARHVCLVIFRVIQFLLSLVALGCGAYITSVYYDMADAATDLLEAIDKLDPENDGVEILQHSLVPVLRHLDGTPWRAIIILVAALWSTVIIIYLFFANRAARNSYRDLKRNSRAFRILLSLLTLILWIAAIACSVLLVIQFGIFAVTVGAETKIAMTVSKQILFEMMQQAGERIDVVNDAMTIVGSIMTVGFMGIVLLVCSTICTIVAFVDCIIACCTSGKGRGQQQPGGTIVATLEKGGAHVSVTPAY